MQLSITPLDAESAAILVSWRYPEPYDMYNIEITPEKLAEEIAYFCDPDNHFYAIKDDHGVVVGHCVFHAEARVPNGDYSADALDVGIGMHPDWTGQGKGSAITEAVLDFAREQYQLTQLRATVAQWNKRAQQVCLNNGFRIVSEFENPKGMSFVILLRNA